MLLQKAENWHAKRWCILNSEQGELDGTRVLRWEPLALLIDTLVVSLSNLRSICTEMQTSVK